MVQEVVIVERRDPVRDATLILIGGAVGIFLLFKWLIQFLEQWSTLPVPYNLVAGFYYYTVVIPFHSFQFVWYNVKYNTLIPYPNINLILACLAVFIYGSLLFTLITLVLDKLSDYGVRPVKVIKLFFLPLLLAILWALGVSIFEWLFST